MEEDDLQEDELEERLYAMIHYADNTDTTNASKYPSAKTNDGAFSSDNPRPNVRRYWGSSSDSNTKNTQFQKINPTKSHVAKSFCPVPLESTELKEEKRTEPTSTQNASIYESPISSNALRSIEILKSDNRLVVELETSDEDEVVEVALPPKPTITIDSSDEEPAAVRVPDPPELVPIAHKVSSSKKPTSQGERAREVSASPVPSVVSSVSDDFIRSDCVALNISSRLPEQTCFDFNLHGADLLGVTPGGSKKKKKKREKHNPTPERHFFTTPEKVTPPGQNQEECFATPKNKAKRKKQKVKKYIVSQLKIPNPDVYDTDSNQSFAAEGSEAGQTIDLNAVTTLPSPSIGEPLASAVTVDLTEGEEESVLPETIPDNIVMANVAGLSIDDLSDGFTCNATDPDGQSQTRWMGSTNVPAILSEDLNFDTRQKNSSGKLRRISQKSLKADMNKFYSESWGGEEFDHREVQKHMSRDKHLWAIDVRDRQPTPAKKRVTCNYCNQPGHRDDRCRFKPAICYICGATGHYEPRCPNKICMNCGSPNYIFSTSCRNCAAWRYMQCSVCHQRGHPAPHCPDLWRRYHNTLDNNVPLAENTQYKKHYEMFCSGCTRRGHLVHMCSKAIPFSNLPLHSPYVADYRPVYPPSQASVPAPDQRGMHSNKQVDHGSQSDYPQDVSSDVPHATPPPKASTKRHSDSPALYEHNELKKSRNTASGSSDKEQSSNLHVNKTSDATPQSNVRSVTVEMCVQSNLAKKSPVQVSPPMEPATGNSLEIPDYISILPPEKESVLQDSEVSNTSDMVTTAKIYIYKDVHEKLKSKEGEEWLKASTKKHNVEIKFEDKINSLHVKGKTGDQEAFHFDLKGWAKHKNSADHQETINEKNCEDGIPPLLSHAPNMPKNKNQLIRKLHNALASLKEDIGDPNAIYKEWQYLQKHHAQLLSQKVISHKQLGNSRTNLHNTVRKLNMVLLGQAGLGEGSLHLNQLYTLQGSLTSYRKTNLSASLREQIGLHYNPIFTPEPRDDYADLLKKYYGGRHYAKISNEVSKPQKKRKRNKRTQFSMLQQPQLSMVISPDQTETATPNLPAPENQLRPFPKKPNQQQMNNARQKIISCQKKLGQVHPNNQGQKKIRLLLLNQMYKCLNTINEKRTITKRLQRQVLKIHREAGYFLQNL